MENRANAPQESAQSTESAPVQRPAPARNVRFPQSPHSSLLALRRTGSRIAAFGRRAVFFFPEPLLLQGIGDVLGHVVLVMLSKHGVGLEHAGSIERTFRDDALPFPKKVRQNSLVGNRQGGAAVADLEPDHQIVTAYERSGLHQAAKPEPLARLNMLLRN